MRSSWRASMAIGGCVVLLVAPVLAPAAPQAPEPLGRTLAAITLSFRRDSRLSGATYGGERWASPRIFTTSAQPGDVGTVDVRVRGVDDAGQAIDIVPEWSSSDPERVSVAPGPKGRFKITVRGAGESRLTVRAQGLARDIVIEAGPVGKSSIQVTVTQ